MKNRIVARNLVAGSVALAAMFLAASSKAETVPQVVTVIKVEGAAQFSYDGVSWQVLKVKDVLKAGAVIQTRDRSLVDIMLGEGDAAFASKVSMPSSGGSAASSGSGTPPKSEEVKANIVRIFEQSMLAIDKLTVERTGDEEVSETQLDLRAGQIMGNVKKLSSASKYEIRLPNGIAGIRGTGYLASSSGEIYVLDGSVLVIMVAPDGTTVQHVVTARHWFNPATGRVTEIPQSDYERLIAIIIELPPTARAPGRVILADRTIIYISPVDGTTAR